MLKIINYSKAYRKDQYAVKNLNLEVEAGDLFAFIGHNGAGDVYKRQDSIISEDELKRRSDEVQKATDKFIDNIDKLAKEKEQDIMSI